MLRNQWKMMKTILLTVTSLLLSVILSAGAHTHQVSADLARHTWAEQHRVTFTPNEPRFYFQLPPLFAYPPALDPRAPLASHMFERPPQTTIPLSTSVPLTRPDVAYPAPLATQQQEQIHVTQAAPAAVQPVMPYRSYITTAYYLNVREEANNKSKIIDVVEKGDILRVRNELDNGWLQLYDEGFVHGAYAEPAATQTDAATRTLAVVKPQADEPALTQTVQQAESTQPMQPTRPEKPTSKVQSKSGLTEVHIEQILKGTELTDKSLKAAILEIEEEYGINAYFTIAVMKLESGNGKSRLAKSKNNLFGLNATGGSNSKAFAFDTKADSVRKFGQLIAESYVGKGYTTIEKVARKYCPPNEDWSKLVQRIMKSDHKKLQKSNLI